MGISAEPEAGQPFSSVCASGSSVGPGAAQMRPLTLNSVGEAHPQHAKGQAPRKSGKQSAEVHLIPCVRDFQKRDPALGASSHFSLHTPRQREVMIPISPGGNRLRGPKVTRQAALGLSGPKALVFCLLDVGEVTQRADLGHQHRQSTLYTVSPAKERECSASRLHLQAEI